MDPVERDELARLVIQAQAGDSSACSVLVDRYWKRIYAFCYRYLHSPARAQELAQDTWLKVVEQIQTLKNPASFIAWLYQIARNLCHDERAKQKRQGSLTEEALLVIADRGESPEDCMDKRLECERVAQAVSRLSEDHRDVLLLVHYQGLSYKEVAEILGISIAVVKTRLFRAVQKVRLQLDSLGG